VKPFAIAVLFCAALALAQDPPAAPAAPAPDPKAVAEELKAALAAKEPAFAVDAVRRLGRTADKAIVDLLDRKALRHKEPLVWRTALQALRFNPDPSALTALLGADVERLTEDDDTAVEYYRALGQKADPKARPILVRNRHVSRGSKVVTARIQAIGRIRSDKAVAELMQLMKSGGAGGGGKRAGGGGRGRNPHIADLRLSLAALTGQDFGNDETAWIRWWADHDERYELPAADAMPKELQRKWDNLWTDKADREEPSKDKKRGRGAGGAGGS